MGNLSFIVPTKKLEDFNIDKIYQLLTNQFNDLYCYIFDYDQDIQILKDASEESKEMGYDRTDYYLDQIQGLEKLKEINPDLENVIQTTYGDGSEVELKQDIDFFLKDYFSAYLLDEGIHPEYMGPDYKRKEENKKIKSFLKFFNK